MAAVLLGLTLPLQPLKTFARGQIYLLLSVRPSFAFLEETITALPLIVWVGEESREWFCAEYVM